MYMCIYIYIYTCIHIITDVCVYIYIYMYICTGLEDRPPSTGRVEAAALVRRVEAAALAALETTLCSNVVC